MSDRQTAEEFASGNESVAAVESRQQTEKKIAEGPKESQPKAIDRTLVSPGSQTRTTGAARVVILAGCAVLIGANFFVLYSQNKDIIATLRELPRVGAATAALGAIGLIMADLGAGGVAAIFIAAVATFYVVANWNTLAGSLNAAYGRGTQTSAQPFTTTQPGTPQGGATK